MDLTRIFNKEKIFSVHNDDLESYLKSLGVFDDILNGKLVCNCCEETINVDNLGALMPSDNNILFVCNKITCLDKIKEEI